MAAKMATVALKLAYFLNYLFQISREGVYHYSLPLLHYRRRVIYFHSLILVRNGTKRNQPRCSEWSDFVQFRRTLSSTTIRDSLLGYQSNLCTIKMLRKTDHSSSQFAVRLSWKLQYVFPNDIINYI